MTRQLVDPLIVLSIMTTNRNRTEIALAPATRWTRPTKGISARIMYLAESRPSLPSNSLITYTPPSDVSKVRILPYQPDYDAV